VVDWLFVGDLIMITAAAGAITFAVSYWRFFNWRKTPAGRALLYFVWALIAVFLNNTAARIFGAEYPYREWVRLIVYAIVALTIWRLVWVLWSNWRADRPGLDIESRTKEKHDDHQP
jgi:NhaP-type Na+/H+ or K+/H+ antiporter